MMLYYASCVFLLCYSWFVVQLYGVCYCRHCDDDDVDGLSGQTMMKVNHIHIRLSKRVKQITITETIRLLLMLIYCMSQHIVRTQQQQDRCHSYRLQIHSLQTKNLVITIDGFPVIKSKKPRCHRGCPLNPT